MFIDRNTKQRTYSPSDLVTFLASPFASWMDRLQIEQPGTLAPDPDDPQLSLAARKGIAHEAAHLGALESQGPVFRIEARSVEATRAAIAHGHRTIFQAALSLGEFTGHADFLVRRDDASEISYDILDTKLARAVKPYFLLQLAAYARMLEAVQGHLPRQVGIVLGNGETVQFATPTVLGAHARVEAQFLALMHGFDADADAPFPDPRADHGRWSSHASARLEALDHLSRVAKITSRQIQRLETAGIETFTALATSKDSLRVQGVEPRVLTRLRQQARLQHGKLAGQPPRYEMLNVESGSGRGLEALPAPSRGDVFFDMEGYPFADNGLEYLFGAVVNETPQFVDWWALDKSQERAALEGFIDFVEARRRRYPKLHVYHYAAYEPSRIKRLAGHYGTREDVVDDWLRNGVFVDLLGVVRESICLGEPGYSLKNVEHLYRDERAGVTNAGQSIVEFGRFFDDPDATRWEDSAILRPIRDYNEDDCVSTRDLRDWLLARQKQQRVKHVRPFANDEPAQPSAARLETDELVRGLLRGADGVSHVLAHAIGYHAREDKPQWWALFHWQTLESSELVDDAQCLGGLTLIKRLANGRARYAVPAQECKLEAGTQATLWSDLDAAVRIESLDHELAVAVLDFGDAEPPRELALTPGKPFDSRVLNNAIRRAAERWIAEGSLTPALDTLLRRAAPRLDGPLQLPGEAANDALVRVAPLLRETCLVVQGPPGAGKTTSAAKAIVALLALGLRIGVTSNAHKAVDKLLLDVRKLAKRACILKVQAGEREELLGVETVPNVKSAFSMSRGRGKRREQRSGGVLVGAVLRPFASKEAAQSVDVLFVDEASQVALADVVAIAAAGKSLVLLGDPRQLGQPTQGTHPEPLAMSALEYFLNGATTLPEGRGLFLDRTYRLHPALCTTISDLFYDGRLHPASTTPVSYRGTLSGVAREAGVCFVPVAHEGNTQSSAEEIAAVQRLVEELCKGRLEPSGRRVRRSDILVIAPYNLQVIALSRALPGMRVGTVDKFQGQEAPIVIFSMATSSAAEAPRGLEFLFDARRLNVALSRAQALAVIVGSPALAMAPLGTVKQYLATSLFCRLTQPEPPMIASGHGRKKGRKPLFFVRPGTDPKTGRRQKASELAGDIANATIAMIERWRKDNGLPPMED